MVTTKLQCELADISIKLGDNKQAINICSQILNSSVSEEFRNRARTLLGQAHSNQKEYDKAAKAFSGSSHSIGAKQL